MLLVNTFAMEIVSLHHKFPDLPIDTKVAKLLLVPAMIYCEAALSTIVHSLTSNAPFRFTNLS